MVAHQLWQGCGEVKERLLIEIAATLIDRMLGLLRKDVCTRGEILMIVPCKSVHSFGMKTPIDVAFIDKKGRVRKTITGMLPGRVTFCRHAACVLERRNFDQQEEGPTSEEGQRRDHCAQQWFTLGETIGFTHTNKGE